MDNSVDKSKNSILEQRFLRLQDLMSAGLKIGLENFRIRRVSTKIVYLNRGNFFVIQNVKYAHIYDSCLIYILRGEIMQKTTDFLTLPILSIDDCAVLGEVEAVLFERSAKQALYLSFLWQDKLALLPFDKILCKADAIVIDSALSLVDACDVDATSLLSLDGKAIFSASGENKGKIEFVELFASGKTSKIFAGETSYLPSTFQAFGDVLILKQAKRRAPRHTIPRDASNRTVQLFDGTPQTTQPQKPILLEQGSPMFSRDALEKIVGKEVIYEDADERTPARVITDYDFLLGRTLLRDLNTYAGTLLAKAGTLVTKELVETAARHGKLVDLTLNSSYK